MADRGHESPMDFQWEGSGPIDPNSPFRMSGPGNSFTNDNQAKKRNHSIFQSSPIKPPALSPPVSQPFLFSTPYSQAPRTPHPVRPPPPQPIFKTPSFTTPRYSWNTPSRESDIFSEGTPHTPEPNSEAPTPEAPRTGLSETKCAGNKAVALVSLTPSRITGRGELRRGLFHDTAVTKARRRRQQQQQISTHDITTISEDEASGDDTDNAYSEDESPTRHSAPRQSWRRSAKSAAASWVATHRELPLIVSHYLQLFFNMSLILLLLYALFCFYLTIRRDVDQKVEEYSAEILQEISQCSRDYIENRCAPDMRVPAMEMRCIAWEKCMNRDPSQVGRARVSAETFAEIINSFIEPISYKTMFFCLLLIFGGLFISNFAFGFYRAKAVEHPPPYQPYNRAAVPPTPMETRWDRDLQQQIYDQQLHQQLNYHNVPGTPTPSTPVKGLAWQTPGKMGGRDRTGRKEFAWR